MRSWRACSSFLWRRLPCSVCASGHCCWRAANSRCCAKRHPCGCRIMPWRKADRAFALRRARQRCHWLDAEAALEELALSRLFLIAAAQSPFKPGSKPAPAAERMRLLRLALAGKTDCEIEDQEIKRGGISYTIDTLRDYARRYPQA